MTGSSKTQFLISLFWLAFLIATTAPLECPILVTSRYSSLIVSNISSLFSKLCGEIKTEIPWLASLDKKLV